jgi:hypothetical protein
MFGLLSLASKLLGIFSGVMSWFKIRAAKQEGRNEQAMADMAAAAKAKAVANEKALAPADTEKTKGRLRKGEF